MARTKRPSKAYRPKAVIRNPLSIFGKFDQESRDRADARYLLSLEAIAAGRHPGEQEWRDLADVVNHVETAVLVYRHANPADVVPTLRVAVASMKAAAQRLQGGEGMHLDPAGLQALRDVIDIYAQMGEELSAREVERIEAETQRRVNQVLNSKRHKPGVVIV